MIPDELKEYAQWVCWKYAVRQGKKTKLPYCPKTGQMAKTNEPLTWSTYREAVQAAPAYQGIGFVFTAYDEFVGIDLDHCLDSKGVLSADAEEIIQKASSYTEISPSGNGIHIIVKGRLAYAGSGFRTNTVEVYQKLRYFTVTGNSIGSTTISYAQDLLTELVTKMAQKKIQENLPSQSKKIFPAKLDHSDQELLELLFRQRNGDLLRALYNGENARSGDASRDDFYFCSQVNFRNGNNLVQTDRIFRQSGRMRKKWDERHYASGETYGERLLKKSQC